MTPHRYSLLKKLTVTRDIGAFIRPAGLRYPLLLDNHEAILVNGAVSQSPHLGTQTHMMTGHMARAQIAQMRVENRTHAHPTTARFGCEKNLSSHA
ncbi:hypothetical protein [Yoonia sp. MH D7]